MHINKETSAELRLSMPKELRTDLLVTYATEFLKCAHQLNPKLGIWEAIEDHIKNNLDCIVRLKFSTIAQLAMLAVQKEFDAAILKSVKDAAYTYLEKTGGFNVPLLKHEVEPLSMIMGSLHVQKLLDDKFLAMVVKRFIASLYHDKLPVAEVARLYLDPRVYQIYAKSTTEEAAYQTYEKLKASLF